MPTPTLPPKTCVPVPKAVGPAARIEQCACCGTFTVHLGALSFRVDREVLRSLWQTIGEALSPASRC